MVRTGSNRKMILHLYLKNVVAVVWLLSGVWPLQLHGLQHTRLPCSSLSHGVCSYSCPLSQWCHPTISFSVIPFSSHLQSFLASGYFPMSWLFNSGGQSIGPSASVLPMNIQDWFLLGLTGLISSLSCPRDSQESSRATQFKSNSSSALSLLYGSTLTSHMTTGKTIVLTIALSAKWCLCFIIRCLELS